jgi:hypothetical protein
VNVWPAMAKMLTNLIKQNPEQKIAFRESVRKRTRNKNKKKKKSFP